MSFTDLIHQTYIKNIVCHWSASKYRYQSNLDICCTFRIYIKLKWYILNVMNQNLCWCNRRRLGHNMRLTRHSVRHLTAQGDRRSDLERTFFSLLSAHVIRYTVHYCDRKEIQKLEMHCWMIDVLRCSRGLNNWSGKVLHSSGKVLHSSEIRWNGIGACSMELGR